MKRLEDGFALRQFLRSSRTYKLIRIGGQRAKCLDAALGVIRETLANVSIPITNQQGLQGGAQLALASHNGSDVGIRIACQPLQHGERNGLVVGYPSTQIWVLLDDGQPNLERCLFVCCTIILGRLVTLTKTRELLG